MYGKISNIPLTTLESKLPIILASITYTIIKDGAVAQSNGKYNIYPTKTSGGNVVADTSKTPIVTEDDGKLQLTRKYTIQFGDTLTSLSHQSGIPISTIKDDNNIENANNIYMNQNIVLNYRIEPEDLDYYTQTVEMDGKSISQIASEYNTTINTLIEMNGEDIQNYNNGTIKVPNFISPEKLEELKPARQR